MNVSKAALFGMLVVASVLVAGTTGVAAQSNSPEDSTTDASVVELGSHDIVIQDLTVTIRDTHVRGTGLPSESVDDATYTIQESHVSTDGFLVTVDGTTYRICAIDVTIDDVGVELQNVSVGEA
ncbi:MULTISPECIES: hypothetical protein [unclassified Haladaptatus]|uniref:hypothetical protein n=1 Tax=unclassified Haladaptatus TaxID=2622732 RepID=UPI0023E7E228|nr:MULTISPECIES: hypothetical protein [unclassified Haladaptatus]